MLDVVITEHAVKIGPDFSVTFQRTLRVPEDNQSYPLPPGLGAFPVYRIEDYWPRVPEQWRVIHGGFIPMYQREALWLGFDVPPWKAYAVQIFVGHINILSRVRDDEKLRADPQNYLVCPKQPWLDGIKFGDGTIRQFVAMPLGLGYTVEASITGDEQFGGIQIRCVAPKAGNFSDKPQPSSQHGGRFNTPQLEGMGLGASGLITQKIYPDSYGVEIWDEDNTGRVCIHIVNSAQFVHITGLQPPPTPIDARTYTEHGLPWFDLYDETSSDIELPRDLKEITTVRERDKELGTPSEDRSLDVPEDQVVKLGLPTEPKLEKGAPES